MKIGLIGLQNSGKTTIFNALTGMELEVTSYASQKVEPNLGMVTILDKRVTKLAEIYKPKKSRAHDCALLSGDYLHPHYFNPGLFSRDDIFPFNSRGLLLSPTTGSELYNSFQARGW